MATLDSTAGGSAGNPIPIHLAYESQTWDGALTVQPLLGPRTTLHDLVIMLELEVPGRPPWARSAERRQRARSGAPRN